MKRKRRSSNGDNSLSINTKRVKVNDTGCDLTKGCEQQSCFVMLLQKLSQPPSLLLGRAKEAEVISNFFKKNGIEKKEEQKERKAMYISGAPGCGKSSLLNLLLPSFSLHSADNNKGRNAPQVTFLNCMHLKKPDNLFKKLCEEMGIKYAVRKSVASKGRKKKTTTATRRSNSASKDSSSLLPEDALKYHFTHSKTKILLIADEIDQLETKDNKVLYKIFSWPHLRNSKLTLIGIANAVDMTDRMLPRLHRTKYEPEFLHFLPYTPVEIVKIIKHKFKDVPFKVFDEKALQLLAKMIENLNSDIRKALAICRATIELVQRTVEETLEKQHGKAPTAEMMNSMAKEQFFPITARMVNQAASPLSGSVLELIGELPLQQKQLLCAVVLLTKRTENKITDAQITAEYNGIPFSKKMSQSDCIAQLKMLGDIGLINYTTKTLLVDANDIYYALEDGNAQMLAKLIEPEDTFSFDDGEDGPITNANEKKETQTELEVV